MKPAIDRLSYIAAGVSFLLSLLLFYTDTGIFMGSLAAALMTGALVWVSWVLMRWLFLALK